MPPQGRTYRESPFSSYTLIVDHSRFNRTNIPQSRAVFRKAVPGVATYRPGGGQIGIAETNVCAMKCARSASTKTTSYAK